jgi:4-carboxymuconolactone decarboxylase
MEERYAMSADSADEEYRTALATAGELLGQRLDLPLAPGEPAAGADFRKVATVHAFADSWTRTALSTHDRALVSVAIAATLGAQEPLRGQLRIALNNQVTKEEVVDLFIHLAVYAGVARAFETYQVALAVFAEHPSSP